MKIKCLLRKCIRKILRVRNHETISDGLQRRKYNIARMIPHKKYGEDALRLDLIELGIKKGDTLIVHSSWRGMYALDMTPEKVVDVLLDLVGEEGTLIMPCYQDSKDLVDLDTATSNAGVLTEVFRKKEGIERSIFPKFSMIAYGRNAERITKDHHNSSYQFDEHSPYSIAMNKYDAKVLYLGLGINPHKITVFHCASYTLRDREDFYKNCYIKKCHGSVIYRGVIYTFAYLDRDDGYRNNKAVFRGLFKKVPKDSVIHRGYSLVFFNAKDAYNVAYEFCIKGGELYKH